MTPIAALQAAAMPELYSSMPSSPQINVLYLAPGQKIISPEQFMASNPEILAEGAGTQLAKMSPSMLVKHGTHAMRLSLKPRTCCTWLRDYRYLSQDYLQHMHTGLWTGASTISGVSTTHIFMELIEGEDLGKSWGKCTSTEKQMISADLKRYMTELRSLPAAYYIGSVHEGPVTDVILEWSTTFKGPFKIEKDFNATIADAFVAKSKGQVGPFIRGMLDAHKHGIVYTHGDLRLNNIIVKDGRVTAITDWEMAGWYPEYWEFVKAFHLEAFTDDWSSHLLEILTPCYCEQFMYAKLMSVLW